MNPLKLKPYQDGAGAVCAIATRNERDIVFEYCAKKGLEPPDSIEQLDETFELFFKAPIEKVEKMIRQINGG